MLNDCLEVINFNGFPLIMGSYPNVARLISEIFVQTEEKHIVSHINALNYYRICLNPELKKEFINNSMFIFDGLIFKFAMMVKGKGIKRRLNCKHLFPFIMSEMCSLKIPVYFLGNDRNLVESVVRHSKLAYPEIQIAGYNITNSNIIDEYNIVKDINKSGAKMLISGLGILKEARFSLNHSRNLNVNAIWNVGDLFEFIYVNRSFSNLTKTFFNLF